jgi:hypothetical protein
VVKKSFSKWDLASGSAVNIRHGFFGPGFGGSGSIGDGFGSGILFFFNVGNRRKFRLSAVVLKGTDNEKRLEKSIRRRRDNADYCSDARVRRLPPQPYQPLRLARPLCSGI